jgi:hypothetical protein
LVSILNLDSKQDTTGHDRTGRDKIGQDKTGQDRTRQDKTGQNRTGQDSQKSGGVMFGREEKVPGTIVCLSASDKVMAPVCNLLTVFSMSSSFVAN